MEVSYRRPPGRAGVITSGSEESTLGFYARLTLDRGTANHVAYEGAVGSNHAQPTLQYGAPCGGHNKTASNLYSYIEDCGCATPRPYSLPPPPARLSYGITLPELEAYCSCGADDGAGGVLNHMYGNDLTKPKAMDGTAFDPANLIEFDQSAFWINATHPELKNANLPPDGVRPPFPPLHASVSFCHIFYYVSSSHIYTSIM